MVRGEWRRSRYDPVRRPSRRRDAAPTNGGTTPTNGGTTAAPGGAAGQPPPRGALCRGSSRPSRPPASPPTPPARGAVHGLLLRARPPHQVLPELRRRHRRLGHRLPELRRHPVVQPPGDDLGEADPSRLPPLPLPRPLRRPPLLRGEDGHRRPP